jgi:hypothetical protein
MARKKLHLTIAPEQNPFCSLSPEQLLAEYRARGVDVEAWDRKSLTFIGALEALPVALREAMSLRLREVGKVLAAEERKARLNATWRLEKITLVHSDGTSVEIPLPRHSNDH